jgi:hypothetical protein
LHYTPLQGVFGALALHATFAKKMPQNQPISGYPEINTLASLVLTVSET